MKEQTTAEIAITLKYIQQSLDDLHKKADYTNGKVASLIEFQFRSEKDIAKIENMEKQIDQAKGTISFLKWIGLSGLVGIIGSLISTMS